MKKLTGMIAFLLLCALSNSAFAVPLYSNGGFVDTGDAYDITGDTVSNSFTLTGNTPVTGVSFYSYNTTGNPTSTVDWAITSAALSGTTLFSGTSTVVTSIASGISSPEFNALGLDVFQNTFSVGSLSLSSNTYWLQLTNATTPTPADTVYWDENNGTSTAISAGIGSLAGSEAFQILGANPTNGSPVPEPSSMLLFGAGIGGLAFLRRKSRKQ